MSCDDVASARQRLMHRRRSNAEPSRDFREWATELHAREVSDGTSRIRGALVPRPGSDESHRNAKTAANKLANRLNGPAGADQCLARHLLSKVIPKRGGIPTVVVGGLVGVFVFRRIEALVSFLEPGTKSRSRTLGIRSEVLQRNESIAREEFRSTDE
jgi:hypothetical protein